MKKLGEIWSGISGLIKDGFSIIAVRDKDEGIFAAKTPYGRWKQYQSRRADEAEVWQLLEINNTSAIAVVCGAISGNLECIDIDSKYNPGIDAHLLKDIKSFYPALYERLRIHKTPSGGYHIIYRVEGGNVPGNIKLASRPTTEKEQQKQLASGRKRPDKSIAFLETRGEGGYFLFPPALGYTVHQDMPVPVLTWEERSSLITLCKSYNEVIDVAPSPRPTKAQDRFYTTNPFEDFNNRCNPDELMQEVGWKKLRHENNKFSWYTRPGKGKGVSASFNHEKRVFYMFTTSTDVAGDRGYNPASILAEFKFDGDRKSTYKWLVDNGFGEVKKSVEQSIIKKAALNRKHNVQANFSEEAKRDFETLKAQYEEDHPFGVFWSVDHEGKVSISHEILYNVAKELGFRSYNNNPILINGKFVEKVTQIVFFDTVKEYIKEEEEDLYLDICDAYEKFIQRHGKFIVENRLEKFDDSEMISDTVDTCWKFYNNTAVEITPTAIKYMDYDKIDGFVWADKVFKRNYQKDGKASNLYMSYLKNATGSDAEGNVHEHVRNVVGYLCHDFKSEAAGYIIVLQEMVLDPKDGGGSGKNVFGNILNNMTSVKTVPGAMVKFDDKFFAAWNGERVYFLADIPRKIDWGFLKEMATGEGYVNKKYLGEYTVSAEFMAKLLINTNFSFEDTDGGLKRRIIPVEFTDYYTLNGGIDVVHGKMFPSGWNDADWKGFDDTIISYIQYHLRQGGKLNKPGLSELGWIKKFVNQYNQRTYEYIHDNIKNWIGRKEIASKDFASEYDEYANLLKDKYKLGSRSFINAVKEYCDRYNVGLEVSKQIRSMGGNVRSHIFDGTDADLPHNEDLYDVEEELPF